MAELRRMVTPLYREQVKVYESKAEEERQEAAQKEASRQKEEWERAARQAVQDAALEAALIAAGAAPEELAKAKHTGDFVVLEEDDGYHGGWTCCESFNQNSMFCMKSAYCQGCEDGGTPYAAGRHESPTYSDPPHCEKTKGGIHLLSSDPTVYSHLVYRCMCVCVQLYVCVCVYCANVMLPCVLTYTNSLCVYSSVPTI